MIGARGVPANYSGVEQAVESLGAALVQRGHQVTVFCRREPGQARPLEYRGMRLRYLAAARWPGVATFVHAALSTVCALRGYDVIHYNALGPNLFSPLARLLSRAHVVTTVHGRDDQRAKWGRVAKRLLKAGAYISARVPHTTIVVSEDLQRGYASEFGRRTALLLNSLDPVTPEPGGRQLRELGVSPGGYVIYIGRLVAEKSIDTLLTAYRALPTSLPFLIVAELDPGDEYICGLLKRAEDDPRVRLIGARYGHSLAELFTNAALYVTASTLEGMPFALSEALQYGVPVVASDIGPHRDLLGGEGPGRRLVPVGDALAMARVMDEVLNDQETAGRDVSARATVISHVFSPARAAELAERIYRGALPSNGHLTGATVTAGSLESGRAARSASRLQESVS